LSYGDNSLHLNRNYESQASGLCGIYGTVARELALVEAAQVLF